MPLRLGPGPVFAYEWLTAARRWQTYALRVLVVGLILVAMAMAHASLPKDAGGGPRVSLAELAVFGGNLYRSVAWAELTLILLVAPAITAGAICLDRARGTLDHMLATDLSNAEIVLGKLGVRLIPLLGLVACTMPVLALASLLGGIAPTAMIALLSVATGCAALACALAMALSVHGRKTHEVVIAAFMLILGWLAAPMVLEVILHLWMGPPLPPPPPGAPRIPPPPGPPGWLIRLHEVSYEAHPYLVAFAAHDGSRPPGATRFLDFLPGSLAASAVLVVLAIARVRRVALKPAGRPSAVAGRRRRRWRPWLPGPSLDRNPVAWREWHHGRRSRMMAIAWGGYAAMGLLWVGLTAWMPDRGRNQDHMSVAFANMLQETIGLLILSVGAAASLAEERARGRFEVLLSTPMSTRSILAGQWWGNVRGMFAVALWPAATAGILAYHGGSWIGVVLLVGLILAHGAAITSLGVAIATWISRPGRAIGACAVAVAALAIGWPIALGLGAQFLANLGISFGPLIADAFLTGSPPFGAWFATLATSASGSGVIEHGASRGDVLLWTFGWTAVFVIGAAAIFRAAAATLDDCLGRIPEEGMRPPPRPRRRSSLSADELRALVPSPAEES